MIRSRMSFGGEGYGVCETCAETNCNCIGTRETLRIVTNERDESIHAIRCMHDLLFPGQDFYSWQKVWQQMARMVLEMPDEATVDEIRLALTLRN